MKIKPCPDNKAEPGDRDEYTIETNKIIGYDRDTGEQLSKLFIVVERNTNKLVTAFPIK
ncbi:hypothetical protein [Acinetobacter lanii]|uniref:Uncharacterized protein n=1 Tax=Acinetobacter lanii TaxID=2715163 RepID=A0A6G8S3Y4_9GAMM|nr:hypothetical protein [Acinetobacter lanii]QIO08926.1 hypothetical protein G8D99_07810 [Acinetobacter lanii]